VLVDEQTSSPGTVTSSSSPPHQQLADILKPCADKISIEILLAIETANSLNIRSTGPYLRDELEIGKKQFYSRIHRLKQQGIIKHAGQGTYVLTTFGKIITGNVFSLVNTCIENVNELHVIDGIDNNKMSAVQYTELVNKLIADPTLRDILK
jgi:hypothetical protein